MQRKLASSLKPVVTISLDGKQWTIKSASTFKTTTINFVDGIEFDDGILVY